MTSEHKVIDDGGEGTAVETEASLRAELAAARRELDELRRQRDLDALLIDADTVDLDAARALAERALASMDEPDAAAAVDQLRRRRAYLFRQVGHDASGALSPRLDETADLELAAERAATSGDRRDLLRYLRLRRK
jgi:hypothetical protein